jgi:spore coat protein M
MNMKKCSNPMNIDGIEEWMTQFFTDPFTTLLDEHTFRVDLFETSEEFIIEAELGEKTKKDNIKIAAYKEKIKISLCPNINQNNDENSTDVISRTIKFPYKVEEKVINATFSNGILEIKIGKHGQSSNKNSTISINS